MARVMSTLGSSEFWDSVVQWESAAEAPGKRRASHLLQYRNGASAGEKFRKKLRMDLLMRKYREKQSGA